MNTPNPDFIKAAKEKDPQKLLDSLSEKDRQKVNELLSDKEALANLLKSPKAMALMKMLYSKDKNG